MTSDFMPLFERGTSSPHPAAAPLRNAGSRRAPPIYLCRGLFWRQFCYSPSTGLLETGAPLSLTTPCLKSDGPVGEPTPAGSSGV
jgi:hypothetical protein